MSNNYSPVLAHPITLELHLVREFNSMEKSYWRYPTWAKAQDLLALAHQLAALSDDNQHFLDEANRIMALEG